MRESANKRVLGADEIVYIQAIKKTARGPSMEARNIAERVTGRKRKKNRVHDTP